MLKLIERLTTRKTLKAIQFTVKSMLDRVEEIKKIALQKQIPMENLFEFKRLIQNPMDIQIHKMNKKKFEIMNMLLNEIIYKMERGDIQTLNPYTQQLVTMITDMKKAKIDMKKVNISKTMGEDFVVDLNVSEVSTKINKLTQTIQEQLSYAKSLSPNGHEYEIISNRYSITKEKLSIEFEQLKRLLSAKKRRQTFAMLSERDDNIQLTEKLVGASFEEAQELLNHVKAKEDVFDQEENNWKELYQSNNISKVNMFNDTLSKDIEYDYIQVTPKREMLSNIKNNELEGTK